MATERFFAAYESNKVQNSFWPGGALLDTKAATPASLIHILGILTQEIVRFSLASEMPAVF
jgi:hypothetical protein